ncbi:MAG TPA: primosomal replication protein N [Gammaproteobacteria bacterium]
MTEQPVNALVIEGLVMQPPETRISPAGIPISRFAVEHQSQCEEAGMAREVRFRIGVVASGQGLQALVAVLKADSRVRITGFLARAGYRSEEHRLLLHAQSIDILNDADRQTR